MVLIYPARYLPMGFNSLKLTVTNISCFTVIKDQNTFTRKIKEAILIKAANPGLNRNKGVEMPDIWWPLLLKRQNLPRVSEDIGIQSIDTSQRTDRSRPLTSARDLQMGFLSTVVSYDTSNLVHTLGRSQQKSHKNLRSKGG